MEVWSKEKTGYAYPADPALRPTLEHGTEVPPPSEERQKELEQQAQRWGPGVFISDSFRLQCLARVIGALRRGASMGAEKMAALVLQEEDILLQQLANPYGPEDDVDTIVHFHGAAESVPRTVQSLHFLVDDAPALFWQTRVSVDAQRPPAGKCFWDRKMLTLELPLSNLRGLFGFSPYNC